VTCLESVGGSGAEFVELLPPVAPMVDRAVEESRRSALSICVRRVQVKGIDLPEARTQAAVERLVERTRGHIETAETPQCTPTVR
jgi:hypothetical protein